MAWTDERLDDLAGRMDAGFARVDGELRDLRHEVRALRTDMQAEFRAVRSEMRAEIGDVRSELRADIDGLRLVMVRFGIAIVVAMAGLIATLAAAIATGPIGG